METATQEPRKQEVERNNPAGQEEEIDIDLNDPEVAAAANKIQAKFRGKLGRKMFGKKEVCCFAFLHVPA